jgi:CRISPR-associated endonuclease/helicase Cas3
VNDLLFDRWSYTTIVDTLAGRPPVAEWLHGVSEWELPRTTIAWRREVAWLEAAHLGEDSLAEFLSDYPLRSRETSSDRTDRVVKHLRSIVERDESGTLRGWLLRHGSPAEFWHLADLVAKHDPKKNPLLHGATVVLPPQAGGLRAGLLDGKCRFESGEDGIYDLGPRVGERAVLDDEEEPPSGMRLVRTVLRRDQDENIATWRLYVTPRNADDEGSRTSRSELRLDDHLRRTEYWARRIAERLGLPMTLCEALGLAGRWHDLGKQRRRWQRSIKNFGEPALAKGRMNPAELGHYRHELGSLHDALRVPTMTPLPEDMRDLALHLIAAHHGRARPHFPSIESFDPEVRDDVIAPLVAEVPLRFDRLQRQFGRWSLAWLESLLRAADVLGSDAEEVAS